MAGVVRDSGQGAIDADFVGFAIERSRDDASDDRAGDDHAGDDDGFVKRRCDDCAFRRDVAGAR
jgi:hypothetical protein